MHILDINLPLNSAATGAEYLENHGWVSTKMYRGNMPQFYVPKSQKLPLDFCISKHPLLPLGNVTYAPLLCRHCSVFIVLLFALDCATALSRLSSPKQGRGNNASNAS